MTEPLSPAALAVLNGFRAVPTLMDGPSIAGALRAAADQVVPDDGVASSIERIVEKCIRSKLLAIATELEATDD